MKFFKNYVLLFAFTLLLSACQENETNSNRQVLRKYSQDGKPESIEIQHRDGTFPDTLIFYNYWGGPSSLQISHSNGRTEHLQWWASGGLWREYWTLEGREHGPIFEFHSNGVLKWYKYFENGIQIGETCSWDMEGNQLHYATTNENGEPCGPEYYYSNGGRLDTIVMHLAQCQ